MKNLLIKFVIMFAVVLVSTLAAYYVIGTDRKCKPANVWLQNGNVISVNVCQRAGSDRLLLFLD